MAQHALAETAEGTKERAPGRAHPEAKVHQWLRRRPQVALHADPVGSKLSMPDPSASASSMAWYMSRK